MDNLARVVHEIPARPELVRQQSRTEKLRVAAYCRVSTDDEEQLTSYKNQIESYTQKINENPDWTLVSIFADEGITGTSMKKRDEFNKMLALCKRGKIDFILTKSIPRFARNTLDSIACVRQLKLMGIGVIFERENINTLHMSNEMVFTMLSAFAQAESESISENVRWGIRHSMKQGRVPFQYKRILGYERGADGKPVIAPKQAAIVRRIFASYLAGYSIPQIKAELEAESIPAASGEPVWSVGGLSYMLQNEKYMGDALLQKTYVVDCISKQIRKNNGELAQYYIENNHDAIISREIFHQVREELARRGSKRRVSDKAMTERGKYSGKYALSELLVCGECGTRYRRVTWARNGKKKIVWRCINRLEHGLEFCKTSPTIEESVLHDAVLRGLNSILAIREDVMSALDAMIHDMADTSTSFDRSAAQQRLAELENKASNILALVGGMDDGEKYFEEPLTKIYDERSNLIAELDADEKSTVQISARSARLRRLMTSIRSAPAQIDEYDDAVTRELVEEVRVLDAESLIVVLKGGFEIAYKPTQAC